MLILFSPPENHPNELFLLNRMLVTHQELIVHLRKPSLNPIVFEKVIGGIETRFHPRIVIHQHHSLCDFYDLKGVHFTEHHRGAHTLHQRVVSTSFHELADAQNTGMIYDYFFCSPVFHSISKQGYKPKESWDISANSEAFRQKAVALGGIECSRLEEVKRRGFQHIGVLGAVWQAENPEAALTELYRAYRP